MSHEATLNELKERVGTILDLRRVSALVGWDQQTMMPPAGNDARADQLATIDRFSHELFVSDETGKLLDQLAEHESELDSESIDAALVRVTRRDWEKARRVPPELQAELTKAEVLGVMAWAEARRNSDFEAFLPYLEKNVELKHRYLECFKDMGKSDYDILLDDYQEGARSEEITAIFERIKEVVIPLIREVKAAEPVPSDFAHGLFPVEKQEMVGREILERLGYSSESWRLDPTVHPFATSISVDDIRLTTRYSEADAESIFHTAHEFGHGLYENGIDRALERTPLVELNSMVLHESQSRLWENLVCRSRPFWQFFFPRIQEVFPEQLDGVTDADRHPRHARAQADRRGRRRRELRRHRGAGRTVQVPRLQARARTRLRGARGDPGRHAGPEPLRQLPQAARRSRRRRRPAGDAAGAEVGGQSAGQGAAQAAGRKAWAALGNIRSNPAVVPSAARDLFFCLRKAADHSLRSG